MAIPLLIPLVLGGAAIIAGAGVAKDVIRPAPPSTIEITPFGPSINLSTVQIATLGAVVVGGIVLVRRL